MIAPTVSEDSLLRYAQFVCDRVYHFDAAGSEDEPQLILSPCMRTLISLAGITLGRRRATRKLDRREVKVKVKKPTWVKATTTPLVRNVFESFFKVHPFASFSTTQFFSRLNNPERTSNNFFIPVNEIRIKWIEATNRCKGHVDIAAVFAKLVS